jgi:hypothetical protein
MARITSRRYRGRAPDERQTNTCLRIQMARTGSRPGKGVRCLVFNGAGREKLRDS